MSELDLSSLTRRLDTIAVTVLAVLLAKDQEPTETHFNKAIELLELAESHLKEKGAITQGFIET